MTKRQFILGTSGVVAAGIGYKFLFREPGHVDDHLLPCVEATSRWTASHLNKFLWYCDSDRQKLILQSLGKEEEVYDVEQIKRDVRWRASNAVTYPFREKTDYNYHDEILIWLAEEYDVPSNYVHAAPSFVLERKIMDAVFIQIWDKLTPEQRKQVLDSLDKDSKLKDKAGIALAGGAAALTALSATVYFAGFAFYTTMSSVIFSTAGIFGLTVPFAAYAGASTTVGILSGPVGWTILGLSALGSLLMLGSANEAKTAAFVTQVHLIKVQALKNSGKLNSTLKDLAL